MQGLPVGLQFIAGVTDEPLLIELAARFEQASPLNARPRVDASE